jgi:hypothetical protein
MLFYIIKRRLKLKMDELLKKENSNENEDSDKEKKEDLNYYFKIWLKKTKASSYK